MRDVVTGFYIDVLARLMAAGTVTTNDSVLVVCGGPLDESVLSSLGFANVTISNLDSAMAIHRQDAENLSYPNGSFDVVLVHAGLHHCHSPHRALLEMYRVARKCAVAFEARNSLMMRTAVRLGLTMDYEVDAISADGQRGGVADTGTPNFIYRWTEREVTNTIASYDPARAPHVEFFYDLRIPLQRLAREGSPTLRLLGLAVEPLSKLLAALVPKQCNEFAFVVSKDGAFHHWIKV